jgi:hypothetical protein
MPQPVAVAGEAPDTKPTKRPARRQGKQVHAH